MKVLHVSTTDSGGVSDPRKDGDLLRDAMTRVATAQSGNVELIIYGQGETGL